MLNPTVQHFYSNRLNWAERIYAAQNSFNGAATVAAIRAEPPRAGLGRIEQAVRLGGANGFLWGNNLCNGLNTPLLNNTSASTALQLVAEAVPEVPKSISVPGLGDISPYGGSLGLTILVGTGCSYHPTRDARTWWWPFYAVSHYGLLGVATEQPLAYFARSAQNDYVANTCGGLACAARLVLEVPRAMITATAAALLVGIPALICALGGGTINLVQALTSATPVAALMASGNADDTLAPQRSSNASDAAHAPGANA